MNMQPAAADQPRKVFLQAKQVSAAADRAQGLRAKALQPRFYLEQAGRCMLQQLQGFFIKQIGSYLKMKTDILRKAFSSLIDQETNQLFCPAVIAVKGTVNQFDGLRA